MQQTTEKHADLMVAAYFSHEVRKAHALFFQNHNSFQQAFESIEKGWENVKKGQAWTAANLTKDKYAAGFCMSYALSYYPLRMKLHPLEHKKWLEEGLTAAEMLKNKNAESTILSYLGTINIALGNPKEAKRYFERALEIAKDEGTKQHECSILLGIASAQADQGEFEEALQNYEKGVDIARGIGYRRNESYILRDWAVLLAELSRFHEALGYFRQALGIAQEIGDIRIVSQILPNMGFIFNQSADFELAQSCFEKAQVILHQIGDKRGEAIVLYSMGMVYSKLNDPSRAIKCLESALLISREIGDKRTESNALSILSEISDEFGIQTSAIDFGDKAQKKWEEIGHSLYANISREKLEKFKNKREEKIIGFSLLFIGLAIVFLGGYFGNNLGGIIGGFLGILGGILVVVTLPIIIGLLWTLFKTIFVLGKWLMFPRSRKINNIDFPVFIVFGILARILSKIIPGLRRRIEKERNTEEVQKASQYLPDRRDEKAFSDAQKKKIKLRFWNILRDIRARIRSEEILPIKTDLPNQELELNNLAMTFYSLGDYDNAIENYKKIISYFREKEDWKGLGITFYNLALAENRNHNRKHSIELAHHSIQILSQINDVETVDIIRKRLGDWYRKGAPDRKKNTAIGFFLLIIFVAFFLGGLIWGF